MATRGEEHYNNMPFFAAKLYDCLTSVNGANKTYKEIAAFVDNSFKHGKLLDIGTGPGRLLYEINKRNPQIELYGLDISFSMIDLAKRNLQNIKNVNLKVGNIVKTEYQDIFFDCIVCSGTFYNWDKPIEGVNEIFRILKSGKTAYMFETYKDYNKELLKSRLKDNLKGYNFIRKTLSKYFLKKQLRMTYLVSEFEKIIKQSKFRRSYRIQQIELGNLPSWIRIELTKI